MRQLFDLENANGLKMRVSNYGGIIQSLHVPDRNGEFADIVLGFDNIEQYDDQSPYFGAICGRHSNRIAGGRFSLNGIEYQLKANDDEHHLHGGGSGFDKKIWNVEEVETAAGPSLRLTMLSADGDENYPGNLDCAVLYTLTDNNELRIEYRATTDQTTIVNLTQHSYFNLKGAGNGSILDHQLQLHADRFTPTDANLIPTGELQNVADTPLDFREPQTIGDRINADFEPLIFAGGYDHNFVLNSNGDELILAARVSEPASGRIMEVLTTEPGLQFYSGNFLDGTNIGKGGTAYHKNSGLCLEAQHFPDAPNHPAFPSTILHLGEEYQQTTIYRFSVE